jgi:glucokinase
MTAIIVGDVGGTNVRLALATRTSDGVSLDAIKRLPVRDFGSLDAALAVWRDEFPISADHAVFALAGPTGARAVRFTNSDWLVAAGTLEEKFGFKSVTLVNDFAAQARAAPETADNEFEVLIGGEAVPGAPMVVLGPGTGLGLASVVPMDGGWRVVPAEGGHQAFAPRDARERSILEFLARDHGHVSFEMLVSGMGLECLYATLAALQSKPALLKGAPEIGLAAISGDDPIAVEAAETLALMLATFAGNAVLATGAKGGCVIAGGVAEALAPFLRTEAFRTRFLTHGPMSSYFDNLPLRRARNPFAALQGAAFFAPED